MKEFKYLLVVFIIIANNYIILGQSFTPLECAGVCVSNQNTLKSAFITSPAYYRYYDFYNSNMATWIPLSSDEVKIIKINFIIVQRTSSDPQNFSINGVGADGRSDEQFLRDLVQQVNEIYAYLEDPSDNGGASICGSCNQVKNCKLQFSLEGIHYYADPVIWGTTNSTTYSHNPSSEINIYLPRTSIDYSWCVGYSTTNFNDNIKLVINRVYDDYLLRQWSWEENHVTGLAHELGHALGLCHLYLGGGCDTSINEIWANGNYFDDHYGTYPGRCPDKVCNWNADPYILNNDSITNNIMGRTNPNRKYWTSKQIGAIHRNLAFNNTRKYLKNCVHNSNSLIIDTSELWDFNILLDRDIQINSSGCLTLTNILKMPDLGQVNINSGGKMIIQSGSLNNPFGNQWNGIVINSNGILELNSTTISDYSVIVKSGGTLRISGNITVTGNNRIDIESGGYICIDNTATINLSNYLSVINLRNGYIFGVNTAVMPNPGTCISQISSINKTGLGSINLFNSDVYIQNISISNDKYYTGNNISAGCNVTTANPPGSGNVIIQNGAYVIFDTNGIILLDKGFEVQLGAAFEAK